MDGVKERGLGGERREKGVLVWGGAGGDVREKRGGAANARRGAAVNRVIGSEVRSIAMAGEWLRGEEGVKIKKRNRSPEDAR